jgi:hypothetical protein
MTVSIYSATWRSNCETHEYVVLSKFKTFSQDDAGVKPAAAIGNYCGSSVGGGGDRRPNGILGKKSFI